MIDARNMASTIIGLSKDKGIYLDHLKLQKLLYFVALEWVKEFKKYPYKQDIEMWKLGPVINDVYSDYRNNGSSEIVSPAILFQTLPNGQMFIGATLPCDLNECEKELVNKVLDVLGDKKSFDLVNITHEHDPWKRNEKNIIQRKEIKYTLNDYEEIIGSLKGDVLSEFTRSN